MAMTRRVLLARLTNLESKDLAKTYPPAPELVKELAAALVGSDYRPEVLIKHNLNHLVTDAQEGYSHA